MPKKLPAETEPTDRPRGKRKQAISLAKKILSDKTEIVPIDSIQPYPGNPRRGSVPAVAESLRHNGQFRPLVVQRSTRNVLAGNHTWQAAKSLKWTEIAVTFIDVNDVEAARIVLADNRTSDIAGYDAEQLADILNAIPDAHVGTGYSSEDIAAITRASEADIDIDLSEIFHPPTFRPEPKETDEDRKPTRVFEEEDDSLPEPKEKDEDLFQRVPEEMQTPFGLKDYHIFSSSHPWGIPEYRDDMLLTDLPEPLDTWSGSATADDPRQEQDPDFHWFYNYGIDSTTGMFDPQRIVLSFYAEDQWFENWWDSPARMMTKALNAGIKYAVSPNYSQWSDEPKTMNLWSLYRSRWLGRYFQEIGIKVIPDINWRLHDRDWLDNFVLSGIPIGLPWISMEKQTYAKDEEKDIGKDILHIVKTLQPKNLLLYAGLPGRDFVQGLNLPCNVRWLPNRLIRLGKFNADKKKTRKESGEKVRIK